MILAKLKDSKRIESLHPFFHTLFEYVKTNDLSSVPTGRIELEGDQLFINVVDATLMTEEAQKLEVHRAYIDVHIPLGGEEIIGWKGLSDTGISEAPFDEDNDFALYAEPASTYIKVLPGDFLIVYPEDAHAPIIGQGKLRKLIAKVKL